jgi:hypothetical protein
MTIKRIGALSALLLTLSVLAGACSSDSKSSSSAGAEDKTAFCKTNTEINDALKNVTDAAGFLTAIKTQQGKFDAYLKSAPAEVKAEAQLLVEDSKKAISTNDASAFVADPKIGDASRKVDTFCGTGGTGSASSSDASS